MRIWMLAAGAAALAISAPVLADPKEGKGGAKGHSAQVERGGGKAKSHNGNEGRPAKAMRADRAERQAEKKAETVKVRSDRPHKGVDINSRRVVKADHERARDRVVVRSLGDDTDTVFIKRAFDRDLFPGRGRGLIAGCPPGLDKKDNGCLPPGQAKKLIGTAIARTAFANSPLPPVYRTWYRDNDDYMFRAGDGFIYRVDRDDGLIDGIIPMLAGSLGSYGGYYALGDPWPSPYNFYNVPYQYRSTWADRGDDCYRYDGWGAIYRVDCDTSVVNSIVALLAGDLGVGSRLPHGYDVYNVPLSYRSTYFDTPDVWYRYNDGYIYRVDPTTRLITAVIDALV